MRSSSDPGMGDSLSSLKSLKKSLNSSIIFWFYSLTQKAILPPSFKAKILVGVRAFCNPLVSSSSQFYMVEENN